MFSSLFNNFSNSPMRQTSSRRVSLPGSIAPRLTFSGAASTGGNGSATSSATTTQQTQKASSKPFGRAGFFNMSGKFGDAAMMSDARAKREKRKIAETKDGLSIYAFRYAGEPEMRIGLMAQEVRKKRPEAVGMRRDGLMTVNVKRALKGK